MTRTLPLSASLAMTLLSAPALAQSGVGSTPYPTPDPDQPCTMVTDPQFETLAALIEEAHAQALVDYTAHYPDGAYAVLPLQVVQLLEDASAELSNMRAWLAGAPGEGDPYATNYSEAYSVYTWLAFRILPDLTTASHDSTVSAVYHNEPAARLSADLSVEAGLEAMSLVLPAQQCWSEAYLPRP